MIFGGNKDRRFELRQEIVAYVYEHWKELSGYVISWETVPSVFREWNKIIVNVWEEMFTKAPLLFVILTQFY